MDKQIRKVTSVIVPQTVMEGAGVRLKRSIATSKLDYLDPFLLFDHFGSENPDDYIAGFPMHPHRGIETVTYMLAGQVHHKDSLGNSGVIGAGDVQWMTSGRGIMHEEMPRQHNGEMAGFQLWVNLPAELKMSLPRYQEIPSEGIPELLLVDGVKIRVIAGEVEGVHGPVTEIAIDPVYMDVVVPPGTVFSMDVEKEHTVFAYVFEGEGRFGGQESQQIVGHPRLVIFGEGDEIRVETEGQYVRFLLVMGKPLHEPIARYGPFVMNTREEINQALRDIQEGTFIKG
jgi:redox-sensitive bicupin YhaK (pirin superfamily)